MLSLAHPPATVTPQASPTTAIRVREVVKRYVVRRRIPDLLRGRPRTLATALDGVSFEVHSGEILGLLGPNGAGKTTLLKILSTLVLPDAGRIEVLGLNLLRDGARVRSTVAPVSADERSLDWRLSALENLRFYGALQGLGGAALHARSRDVLADVELQAAGNKLVGSFSSGMRQRLLIARALMCRPRILLLDEPTRSLDPIGAHAFRSFLRTEIAERHGCTVLLATHDPEEALELCDRIAILHHGRLLAVGRPAALVREFGDDRYRLWIRSYSPQLGAVLRARGLELEPRPELGSEGWVVAELELPRGREPDEVLELLTGCGTRVGRFEKLQPSVAELMARVIRMHTTASHA